MRTDLVLHVSSRAAQVLILLMLFAAPNHAHACDCPPATISASELLQPNSPALAELPDGMVVIVGRVVAQSQWNDGELTSTTFRVMKVLKGSAPEIFTMRGISGNENSCGLDIYVTQLDLFLIWQGSDREWDTRSCEQPRKDVTYRQLLDFVKSSARN